MTDKPHFGSAYKRIFDVARGSDVAGDLTTPAKVPTDPFDVVIDGLATAFNERRPATSLRGRILEGVRENEAAAVPAVEEETKEVKPERVDVAFSRTLRRSDVIEFFHADLEAGRITEDEFQELTSDAALADLIEDAS